MVYRWNCPRSFEHPRVTGWVASAISRENRARAPLLIDP